MQPDPKTMALHFILRSFQPADLPHLVEFWNREFVGRRNFRPIDGLEFRRRVLTSPAFDPAGLILAWRVEPTAPHVNQRSQSAPPVDQSATLAGLAHAFKPPPRVGFYRKWESHHHLALLYVSPQHRRQGVGSRLLQATENWLTYCPVYVADQSTPCYGAVEGAWAPFFGSSERMGISARESGVIDFMRRHGYRAVAPGDVSMVRSLQPDQLHLPEEPATLAALRLSLQAISQQTPFSGVEQDDRQHYTLLGQNDGCPYAGLVLVDEHKLLRGHLSWHPLTGETGVLSNFWIAPDLRRMGLGSYLLDRALFEMAHRSPPHGGFRRVELHTHVVNFAAALRLYEQRGFSVEDAWVTLVKT